MEAPHIIRKKRRAVDDDYRMCVNKYAREHYHKNKSTKRAYYARNKDEICRKQREKYRQKKLNELL